jgi:hypothetical protein
MIEVVTREGVISSDRSDDATTILKTLPPTSVRLDYHGVLDTLSPNKQLPEGHTYCVVSYVGFNGEKHMQTRYELQQRIQNGQILFGVLVFKKGYKRQEKRTFTQPGSKAWVNANLPEEKPTYFMDDHKEHLLSTQLLCPHIHCYHYSKTASISLSESIESFAK